MKDFDLATYDPTDGDQRAFVRLTFRDSMRAFWPWRAFAADALLERFSAELARPGTVVKLAYPLRERTQYIGWAATRPRSNTLVYAYVKHPYRRMSVGSGIAIEGGVDFAKAVPVTFWTPAAARIRAQHRGYETLYHDLTGPEAFE